MSGVQVEVIRTGKVPDYMMLARAWLPKIREAAEDTEIRKEFEAWKKARNAGQEGR